MGVNFKVLFQDDEFVFIDKPAGYYVHPPEDASLARFCRPERVILSQLRRQLGKYLFPVHRLDVATSGVLVFALSSEAAARFQECSQNGHIKKDYLLLARGWIPSKRLIEIPLESDSLSPANKWLESKTCITPLKYFEVPGSPSAKHATQRYTLARAEPLTGRYHQIRRHLNRVSHPIIGDNDHGDSRQNRFFREKFGVDGLCLWARGIGFQIGDKDYQVSAGQDERLERVSGILSAHQQDRIDLRVDLALPEADLGQGLVFDKFRLPVDPPLWDAPSRY